MTFPVTSIIDDGNRANEGPPPSAQWTTTVAAATTGIKIVSNLFAGDNAGAVSNWGYVNIQQYGPNCEVYVKIASKHAITSPRRIGLLARLKDVGSNAVDGYHASIETDTDGASPYPDKWGIDRIDNGVFTAIGTGVNQAYVSGDSAGFECSSSTLSMWFRSGAGAWTAVMSRSDATYLAEGYVGMIILDTVFRVDDFAGGTINQGGLLSNSRNRLIRLMG